MAENAEEQIKAGDQVWHHKRGEELIVAAVDLEANRIATGGTPVEWIPIGDVTKQRTATMGDHVRQLKAWAPGGNDPRAVLARHALATLWSDGKLPGVRS